MNANAKGAIRPVGVVAVFLLLTVPLSRFLAEPAEDRAPEPVRRLDAGGRRAEEVRREGERPEVQRGRRVVFLTQKEFLEDVESGSEDYYEPDAADSTSPSRR